MSEIIKRPVEYEHMTECLVFADGEFVSLIMDGTDDRVQKVGNELARALNRNDRATIDAFLARVRERQCKCLQCGHDILNHELGQRRC